MKPCSMIVMTTCWWLLFQTANTVPIAGFQIARGLHTTRILVSPLSISVVAALVSLRSIASTPCWASYSASGQQNYCLWSSWPRKSNFGRLMVYALVQTGSLISTRLEETCVSNAVLPIYRGLVAITSLWPSARQAAYSTMPQKPNEVLCHIFAPCTMTVTTIALFLMQRHDATWR